MFKDLYGHCRYIAAQGPIDQSLIDFFHMIWDLGIMSIVCTANDVEAGRVRAPSLFISSIILLIFLV